MKSRTIKKIIRGKIAELCRSTEDEKLKDIFVNHTIVTGGCITSMILNEEVNDFDIYFTDYDSAHYAAQYYIDKFKNNKKHRVPIKIELQKKYGSPYIHIQSAGVVGTESEDYFYFETEMDDLATASDNYVEKSFAGKEYEQYNPRAIPIFLSGNAITLSNKTQLILRFYGDAEEIHKNYDFVHTTNYYTCKDDVLCLRQEALEAIMNKDLIYVGSKYPICSLFRLRKFIKRDWKITAGQVLKIALQISELDLTDIETLGDQLTGVDQAYFMEIIDILKEQRGKDIDLAHLPQLIDKVFSD